MDTAIIFVALIGLMVMAYRGASIILIAPVFAVVAALGSEHASLPVFSELYMTKAAEYLKNYYPIFLFGAVFARLMEKGGITSCGNSQNCVQACPKNIKLTTYLAQLNRDVNKQALRNIFDK